MKIIDYRLYEQILIKVINYCVSEKVIQELIFKQSLTDRQVDIIERYLKTNFPDHAAAYKAWKRETT